MNTGYLSSYIAYENHVCVCEVNRWINKNSAAAAVLRYIDYKISLGNICNLCGSLSDGFAHKWLLEEN